MIAAQSTLKMCELVIYEIVQRIVQRTKSHTRKTHTHTTKTIEVLLELTGTSSSISLCVFVNTVKSVRLAGYLNSKFEKKTNLNRK